MKKFIIVLLLCFAGAAYCHDVVATTIWAEARGEGEIGMRAVASVIWNRSQESGLPPTLVCLKRKQFSCWNNGEPSVDKDSKQWTYAMQLQHEMEDEVFKPLGDWNHYYAHKKCNPKWAKHLMNVKVIRNHTFGTIKRKGK